MNRDTWVFALFCGAIVLLIGICIYAMNEASQREHTAWTKFVVENECRIVGEIPAVNTVSTSLVVNTSTGQPSMVVTPIYIPAKSRWLCNDEKEYIR